MANLYADHNVSQRIPSELARHGHEVITAQQLGLARASDGKQLLTAAQLGRIIVTHNKKDFFLLHDAWREWSAAWSVDARHAGILVCPQAPRIAPQRMTQIITEFFAAALPIAGEFYFWQPIGGWTRR